MRLFRWFILRRLRQEPVRASLSIAGIALGVAVVLAIQIANQSALEGFRAALDTMAGRTSLEIIGAGVGVDERALASLGWLQEWGDVSPVVEGDAMALRAGGRAEAVRVLGIDILKDQPFRDYRLLRTAAEGRSGRPMDVLTLLIEPDAAVVAESFARRRGLSIGSGFDLALGDNVKSFTVRGILRDDGPAKMMGGNFVLLDIAAAQLAFDRIGRVDRVDVRLADPAALDRAERAIGARLPPGLAVQRPARRGSQVEKMLAAFQFNLGALSMVALLVGLFLIYNTVATSVIGRREEIGVLRALGTPRTTVLALFLGEAAALAGTGCVVGIPLGWLLAWGAVGADLLHDHDSVCRGRRARPVAGVVAGGIRLCGRSAAGARRRGGAGARSGTCQSHRFAALDTSHRQQGSPAAFQPARRRRVPPVGVCVRQPAGGQRAAGLRLRRGGRDRIRPGVPGPIGAVLPEPPRQSLGACPGHREPVGPCEPGRCHPAALGLGCRARGEPRDARRDRGDDWQLSRNRRVLGEPDASGRPLHRHGAPLQSRLAGDDLSGTGSGGSAPIATWRPSIVSEA